MFFLAISPKRTFDKDPGIVNRLFKKLCKVYPDIPELVIKFFAKCRIKIRIRYLNTRVDDEIFWKQHQNTLSRQKQPDDEDVDDVEVLSESGESFLQEFGEIFSS